MREAHGLSRHEASGEATEWHYENGLMDYLLDAVKGHEILRFNDAGPIACIRIFPPPLSCQLAEGRTVMALDLVGFAHVVPSLRALSR